MYISLVATDAAMQTSLSEKPRLVKPQSIYLCTYFISCSSTWMWPFWLHIILINKAIKCDDHSYQIFISLLGAVKVVQLFLSFGSRFESQLRTFPCAVSTFLRDHSGFLTMSQKYTLYQPLWVALGREFVHAQIIQCTSVGIWYASSHSHSKCKFIILTTVIVFLYILYIYI